MGWSAEICSHGTQVSPSNYAVAKQICSSQQEDMEKLSSHSAAASRHSVWLSFLLHSGPPIAGAPLLAVSHFPRLAIHCCPENNHICSGWPTSREGGLICWACCLFIAAACNHGEGRWRASHMCLPVTSWPLQIWIAIAEVALISYIHVLTGNCLLFVLSDG